MGMIPIFSGRIHQIFPQKIGTFPKFYLPIDKVGWWCYITYGNNR